MKKNINECLDFYKEEIKSIDSSNTALDALSLFILKTKKFKHKDCLLYKGDVYLSTVSLNDQESIKDAQEEISWLYIDNDGDTNDIKLVLKCEKTSNNHIDIIDKDAFISTSNELSDLAQIKLIIALYHKKIKSISINENSISIEGYAISNETNHAIHYRKDQISDISESYLYPCYIDFICEKLSSDETILAFLKKVRAVLCLAMISKKSILNNEKSIFIFEDDIDINMECYDNKSIIDNSKIIYDIYKWVYNDEKYISKLGILWQLISKSFNKKNLFKTDTLSTLQSLHQIYLKEDFAIYIDLRNKVSDSIIDLTNKIVEDIQQSRTGIKQTLFVTMSYFFSIFVFTAIDKGKLENFLSLPVCILSTFFLCISACIIVYNYLELQDNISFHEEVLNEVKKRYTFLLCDDEINSYFNVKSLNKAISSSKSKTMSIFSISCLFIMGEILWYFFINK